MQVNKNKLISPDFLLYMIPGLFALASVLITNPPQEFDDLLRFYKYYERFQNMSIEEFWNFLSYLSDYLIPIYIYIASKVGIPINVLLAAITYITVFIILKVSLLILKDNKNLILPMFITSSISLSGLLSGVRNLHSIAVVYLAMYLFFNTKYFKSSLLYILSINIHFSSLTYLFVPFLTKIKIKNIHILWWISFVGFIVPFSVLPYLKEIFNKYNYIPIILKLNHYTLADNFYFDWTYNDIKILLVSSFKLSWYVLTVIFLYFQLKNKNDYIWVKVLFIFSILMNLSFLYFVIFERISFFAKIIFVVCLFQENRISDKLKQTIFIYFLILFVFQIVLFFEGLYDFIRI